MRPGARLQAAIEVLERLEAGTAPLDRLLRGYFRTRRYAGARDRAAVAERVHLVLRQRGALLWRCGGDAAPRLLVLASLRWGDGLPPAAIAGLCTGQQHAPAPLTDAEQAVLQGDGGAGGAMPDWAAGNYPAWLEPALARRFGDARLAAAQALNRQAPLDLRVNRARIGRCEALAALRADGIAAEKTAMSPHGLRLAARPDLTRYPLYLDGLVEVQDEGSQLIALLTDARPGHLVADFCAGAGGKSLALAAAMADRGEVHALDSDGTRLARLQPRLRRAGAGNLRSRTLAGGDDPWLAGMAGRFDRVLVDAPCSGSGAWRRQPEAPWRLRPQELARCEDRQRRILERAARLVRPGGRLVYATCSVLCAENEDQVAWFLSDNAGFAPIPYAEVWPRVACGPAPEAGAYLQLSPHLHGTDGFFVAILERRR